MFQQTKTEVRILAKLSISANLGFIVGPALAGVLGGTIYKELLPVLSAVIISSVAFVVVGFMLKESKPKEVVAIQPFSEKKRYQ